MGPVSQAVEEQQYASLGQRSLLSVLFQSIHDHGGKKPIDILNDAYPQA
jgi:hypothetical protein